MPTLMVSISGIRGIVGDGLDPKTIVEFASAYADFIGSGTIVIGRDSRITGEMVKNVLFGTLVAKGLDVIDIGIVPTPTVQLTVKNHKAAGGIAISASHNPNQWNALKLLNGTGQFMTPEEHAELKTRMKSDVYSYRSWDKIGKITSFPEAIDEHIEAVKKISCIDLEAIRKRKFRVVADCVNGAGYDVIPRLLEDFGCEVIKLNCESTGIFPRLPEPIPQNLVETFETVKLSNVDIGIVVDPDVDRLVLITEKGEPFIEENTIAQAVQFYLPKHPGNVVVNLSTTRAVHDIVAANGCQSFRAPVGEANVVKRMKEVGAVIGGEGSGGVILPEIHYGRDALIGIALTLQHLLEFGGTMSEMKATLPQYSIAKRRVNLTTQKPAELFALLKANHPDAQIDEEDGLRLDFKDYWIHCRSSNTEPIIRVICEAHDQETADRIADEYLHFMTTATA
jgi:phosphomannomutase